MPRPRPQGGIAHWDDVEAEHLERGHLAGDWQPLGRAAGSVTVGVNRVRLEPGNWATPAHVEGSEEEIFFVLSGSGVSWQDGKAYDIGPNDCIVHRPLREAHTVRGGDEGLDYLVFGQRSLGGGTDLPRADVAWLGNTWVDAGVGDTPWMREAAAGPPDVGEIGERPANIVNLAAAESRSGGRVRAIAMSAGAQRTGLNYLQLDAGGRGAPPHCHSLEEEIFVVLEGDGTMGLTPAPEWAKVGVEPEEQPVRAGHVIARPPASGIAHHFRAGENGMTLLAYGTFEPNDIAYYPRSNKIYFRGVGLIARIESLDYDDGEPDD